MLAVDFAWVLRRAGLAVALTVGCATILPAQQQGSSSSTGDHTDQAQAVARPRAAQVTAGGSSVTLETNEPLFQLASALNACGYDADLDKSLPVRAEVRADINAALAETESARAARDKLCAYVRLHWLNDMGLNVAQYVSLAIYLSPPPELLPNVDETQLPPQAAAVVNILPLLRAFSETTQLHLIWLKHHAEYEALEKRVHDPMTRMILTTNIYLHQPVSSYDGRRFLVLLEPMLSPNLTNARLYGSDYVIMTSPDNRPAADENATPEQVDAADPVRMDEIRHIYLHYVVEPMIYSRGQAVERLTPLLRAVDDAPLDYTYRTDVLALVTECMIKAIEGRMYVIADPKPVKPRGAKARGEEETQYEAAMTAYDRETALEQLRVVEADEKQGWVLTQYFYDQLGEMRKTGDGLRDEIAPMIYGMDVDRQVHHAKQIVFVKSVPPDPLRPASAPRKIAGLDLAEMDLMKGDLDGAADLADKAMNEPGADHGRAKYILARIDLVHGHPQEAMDGFEATLTLSKDPRTLAWSHIYLGRMYDIMNPPDREKAVAEYKTALEVRDGNPDTRNAAEAGVKAPYALPKRVQQPQEPDDDKDFDPTGKKEKEAYRPE